MKSPFPGMDPYIERYWREIHEGLIIYARDQLQERLPSELRARIDQRVILELESDTLGTVYPDVYVVERPRSTATATAEVPAPASAIKQKPLRITPLNETLTEGYIDIVDASSGNRVITTIEFLSPTNKVPGRDRKKYLRKQREIKRAGANLVEIDLTRTGPWTMAIPRSEVPPTHRTTYRICVWRAGRPGCYDVYRVPLLEPLPTIEIPLRREDSDIDLELQPLVDRCYAIGRYDDLDYKADPNPPFDPEDAKLADEWLRGKELR
jgi:hypothetical protein